jgi:hypothetical protein
LIRVGQLRKWDRSRGYKGEYTYFLVIGERVIKRIDGEEKSFTVRYPNGETQDYWECDLMSGFNEIYDELDGYSSEVGNEQG